MSLLSELKVADARTYIESKAVKTSQRQKRLRDGYATTRYKQRQSIHNLARTKHK